MYGTKIASCWVAATLSASAIPASPPYAAADEQNSYLLAKAGTCKQVNSCEEAVELWCGGYRRADADKDGIPCENICHSKEQVDDIRAQIGC